MLAKVEMKGDVEESNKAVRVGVGGDGGGDETNDTQESGELARTDHAIPPFA